jgi:glycosidase
MPSADTVRGSKLRRHPHLYEINTWAWLEELSARSGKTITLGTVPEAEWDRIRELGFDLVWLMGVWKRSPAGRRIVRTDSSYFGAYDRALPGWTMRDLVGSPYSIQDYHPDPRLGNWDEIDAVRSRLHTRDIRLILDFVPNHTGLDHPWVEAHPEYYIEGTFQDFRNNPGAFFLVERNESTFFVARGKDPYFPPWADTAQLNYCNPATREAMLGVLGQLRGHCDGLRCDMAMLSLNEVFGKTWGPFISASSVPQEEFWARAIAAFPSFIWITEVYWEMESRLQQLGFDFAYDKRFYDTLLEGQARAIRDRLTAQASYQNSAVRFLENHDERRSASAFAKDRLRPVATLAATLPGMRFYHQGQLDGNKLHWPIQLRRAAFEPPDEQIQALYQKLLTISDHEVFHRGDWRLLEARSAGGSSSDNLVAYEWRLFPTQKVVVVNLSDSQSQAIINIGGALDRSATYTFRDELNDKNYEWRGRDLIEGGLLVKLEGYQSQVLDVLPK